MNDRARAYLRLFLLLMLLGPLAGYAEKTAPIAISTGEWPPYTDAQRADGGLALKLVRAAFAAEGLSVEFEWMPWLRAYEYALSGKRPATAVWYYTRDRAEQLDYSTPILRHHIVIYHLASLDFDWRRLEDLSPYRIGTVLGYSYGEPFDLAADLGIVHAYPVVDGVQNLHKLLNHRIDLMVAEEGHFTRLIEQLPAQERARIHRHVRPLTHLHSYLLFSRRHPAAGELKVRFDRGLARLRAQGDLERWLAPHQIPAAPDDRPVCSAPSCAPVPEPVPAQ